MKKTYQVSLVILAFVAGILAAWAFWLEPTSLRIQRYSLSLEAVSKLDTIRIGIVSDIHIGRYYGDEARLERIVDLLKKESPDLVVFLGDFVAQKKSESFLKAAHVLKNLKAPLGVFAVLGNHDWWAETTDIVRALESNNVRLIDNQIIKIDSRGQFFQLAGFGDYWEDQGVRSFIRKNSKFEIPTIGITHNPDIFPEVDPTLNIMLAGHTHGGQVNFPFVGSPIVPSKYGERYRYGVVSENGHHLLVTSGTGNSNLPVRFRVPPEIAILELSFHSL